MFPLLLPEPACRFQGLGRLSKDSGNGQFYFFAFHVSVLEIPLAWMQLSVSFLPSFQTLVVSFPVFYAIKLWSTEYILKFAASSRWKSLLFFPFLPFLWQHFPCMFKYLEVDCYETVHAKKWLHDPKSVIVSKYLWLIWFCCLEQLVSLWLYL